MQHKHTIDRICLVCFLREILVMKTINKSDWSRWGITITNNVGNTHLMIMLWQYYTAGNGNWYLPLCITMETHEGDFLFQWTTNEQWAWPRKLSKFWTWLFLEPFGTIIIIIIILEQLWPRTLSKYKTCWGCFGAIWSRLLAPQTWKLCKLHLSVVVKKQKQKAPFD